MRYAIFSHNYIIKSWYFCKDGVTSAKRHALGDRHWNPEHRHCSLKATSKRGLSADWIIISESASWHKQGSEAQLTLGQTRRVAQEDVEITAAVGREGDGWGSGGVIRGCAALCGRGRVTGQHGSPLSVMKMRLPLKCQVGRFPNLERHFCPSVLI